MIKIVIFFCVLSLWQELSLQEGIPFNVDLQFGVLLPQDAVSQDIQTRNAHYPSLFGSSVLVTSDAQKTHNLFIGSPNLVSKTNSSLIPGGIFKCTIDFDKTNDFRCTEINLSKSPLQPFSYAPKNRSLVGFNLGKNDQNVITCAPNWVADSLTPEGLCFLLNGNSGDAEFTFKLEPKRRLLSNRPYESHVLFGFSFAYNEDRHRMVVGIPGFNDFSGSLSLVTGDLQVSRFTDNKDSKPNSYMGFAVDYCAFGRYPSLVIVGTPKYNKFNGKVDLMDFHNQNVYHSLTSTNDTKGEFFGASLLSIPVGRSKDHKDLLVGAPLFSVRNRREIGRVYYYRNIQDIVRNAELVRHQPLFITPKISRVGAHFGTTFASIDLNMDNFFDVVISAPFEDNMDGSTGAIYIYYGTQFGLDLFSEKRIGSDIFSKKSLRGFGYSLWTGSDVDNNGYNDLVVGSILSDKVSILRSIPIIDLKVSLHFDRKGVNLTDISTCLNENACFRVSYCIVTNAQQDFPADLSYSVHFVVSDRKIRVKENRVIVDKISSVITTNRQQICLEDDQAFYVEIKKKEEIYDIITPIEVQVNVSLDKPSTKSFCPWCPVANPVTVSKEIGFEHGCARKQCVSKLELDVQFKYGPHQIGDSIVQGLYSNIELVVDVRNRGESSIDTQLLISIEPFSSMLRSLETRCRVTTGSNGYSCEVNKLLQKDQKEEFKLHFDLTNVAIKSFSFDLKLNSSSKLAPDSKKIATKKHFSIVKKASFKLIDYKFHNYSFSDQTPRVLFPISYVVDKDGPSSVNSTYIQLYLPDEVIEIDQSSKYRCSLLESVSTYITDSSLRNGTLQLFCPEQTCTRYECSLNLFDPGRQSVNFDLTLLFHPTKIPSKYFYEKVHFLLRVYLFTKDPFFEKKSSLDIISTNVIFERQITKFQTKSSPLIMIGGGGIGLLILLITVIVLIKNGFFKRKKREELLRVKQRMSMNPNLVLPGLENMNQDEDDANSNDERN